MMLTAEATKSIIAASNTVQQYKILTPTSPTNQLHDTVS